MHYTKSVYDKFKLCYSHIVCTSYNPSVLKKINKVICTMANYTIDKINDLLLFIANKCDIILLNKSNT